MQNIKNIIFDYGNVIYDIDFAAVQQHLKQLGIKDIEIFFDHLQQDKIFDMLDRGQITAAEFRDSIRQKSGNINLSDTDIDKAWNSILIGVPKGNNEVLLQLKDKYRTFLLSNNNEIHYTFIINQLKSQYGFEDNNHLFEKTYYSHLVGLRKPEKQLFEKVLNENNLVPEETLFVDDSPQHLEAAKQLGIQTYLMKATDNLQKFASQYLL